MKGAFLYVDAGKGHYIPAVALADSFKEIGHEVIVEDLFKAIGTPGWAFFCKYDWRFCLHHPRMEYYLHKLTDNKLNHKAIRGQVTSRRLRYFKEWYDKERPDYIVSTNFIGGIILPLALRRIGAECPVYQYAADVFETPKVGVNKELDRMYFPSDLGIKAAIEYGMPKELLAKCSFPLQKKFETYKALTKQEARAKLGLKEKFTVLISLGGEGIGDDSILYEFVERKMDVQVVIIGGFSKTTKKAFDKFTEKHPDFDLVRPGFVDNVPDYLCACDIQMGKAGANSLMESLFLKRPCLVSDVLYSARRWNDFFNEYRVGWCENNLDKKVGIIEKLYSSEEYRAMIEKDFERLPLSFGSCAFRDQILEDIKSYQKAKSK